LAKLILNGATSGSISLESPAVSGSNTLTLPANTGTVITTGSTFAGTGPAFRAIASASQTLTDGTWTKVTLGTEAWDTNNNFDSTTNYRFTPTVAGYYQVNGGYSFGPAASVGYTLIASIYNNGSELIRGAEMYSLTGTFNQSVVSGVLYMNGSTDYIELYAIVIGGSISTGSTDLCFMDATLVRSA
jgi:hypothetical protein